LKSRAGRGRAELALAGITVVWGSTFVVVQYAIRSVPPILFLSLRFTVATVVLCAIYGSAIWKQRTQASRWLWPGIAAGILLYTAYVFQTIGLKYTSASKSAFLTGLSIPLVPFVSSFVYRNRPRLFEVAGVLIASAGMALMTLPSGKLAISRGDFLSAICAVAFAFHVVLIGHYAPVIGFETIAVVQVITAAALGLMTFRVEGPVGAHFTFEVAAAVLVTGMLATALAFTTMAWAQQYTSATRAALIFALEPVVAWLTSFLLNGERMADRAVFGAFLILTGIVMVELKRTDVRKHLNERVADPDV
jgi:drug/metabolite transporter (DMT)-like permease